MRPSTGHLPSERSPSLQISSSEGFARWLLDRQLSLAFTTYQTNRLFFIGAKPDGGIWAFERLFDRPMGLHATPDRLYLSTRYQLWQLDNLLEAGETYEGGDTLYVPRQSYITGDVNVHDVAIDISQKPVFVNTQFSCLATLDRHHSFKPIWQPPFISKLVPEDRCHLNGLAMVDGQPRYVSAVSQSDTAAGWRSQRRNGGCILDISTNQIVCAGLSMPHSPRFYRGKLWLLNSGTGEFGYADLERGHFEPIAFCPGFVRGLAFHDNYAIVGLSKPRDRTFQGLAIDERLAARNILPRCGLAVVDLDTGKIVAGFEFLETVKEIFDVAALPGVRQARVVGFQTDEIERLVSFPGSSGLVSVRPTVGASATAAMAATSTPTRIRYQLVCNLNAAHTQEYDALSFPSLKKRWQTFTQRGELIGISASINDRIVGMAIAEILPPQQDTPNTAELISIFVLPEERRRGIGTNLVKYLETALGDRNCTQISVQYQASQLTEIAWEPLLAQRQWQPPQTTYRLYKTTTEKIANAPWLAKYPLPEAFEIFPWHELTADERQRIEKRGGYPQSLNPNGGDPRLEPSNSLGLRYNDEVVGWSVTHRIAPDTIRYSNLFVQPQFRHLGRGISLLAASIQQQIAQPIPNCTWAVAADNPAMQRFAQRHLEPFATGQWQSRKAEKSL